MKKICLILLSILLLFTALQAVAQIELYPSEAAEEPIEGVFIAAEKMPDFPGGNIEYFKFLKENLKYQPEENETGLTGMSIVSFIVEKNGSITQAKILKSGGKEFDYEVLRVVNSMPAWEPGMQRDKPVRVKINLPVSIEEIRYYSSTKPEEKPVEIIYEGLTIGPVFPGGNEGLKKFLNNNLKYPEEEKEAELTGRVLVRFIVEKDGSITHPQIVRSAGENFNQEALKVINSMPNWIPGKVNDKPVRVFMHLPIAFTL